MSSLGRTVLRAMDPERRAVIGLGPVRRTYRKADSGWREKRVSTSRARARISRLARRCNRGS